MASALQAAVDRINAKKPEASDDTVDKLEIAVEDFMEAETAAEKAVAFKAMLVLAQED